MSARTLVYPTADELRTQFKWRQCSPAERLASRYVVEPNGCWRWLRSFATNGYGHFSIGDTYYQAHLIVYILHVGPLPADLEPDHLCRNRWCVNPGHIEFVTHAVNVQRGIRAVLSPEQAEDIRRAHKAGAGVRALGRLYRVNHAQISRIVNGLSWVESAPAKEIAA